MLINNQFNIAYYEWYLSAPIQKQCNSYGPVNVGRNEATNAKNYKFFWRLQGNH